MNVDFDAFAHGDHVVFVNPPRFQDEPHPSLLRDLADWKDRVFVVDLEDVISYGPGERHTLITLNLDDEDEERYWVRVEDLAHDGAHIGTVDGHDDELAWVGHPDNPPPSPEVVRSAYHNLAISIDKANAALPPNEQFVIPFGITNALVAYIGEREAIDSIKESATRRDA